MKLIFGLGNPDTQYSATRHNIGWQCLDSIVSSHQGVFSHKAKFLATIAEISINGEKTLLVKPTTFYNEVGQSLRQLMDFYKLSNNDILVIHDDLALNFGTIRIRHTGSPAGNNGIKSINSHIDQHYARIRIGINNDIHSRINDSDFVLSKFSKVEGEHIESYIKPKVHELTHRYIHGKLEDESFRLLGGPADI